MDEVLIGIVTLITDLVLPQFHTENDPNKQYIKVVQIWDHLQAAAMVSQGNVPCIYITPMGEPAEELGPMASTKTREFNANIRVCDRSSDPAKLRQYANPNSPYKIQEAIRAALANHKNIAALDSGYSPYYLSAIQPSTEKSDNTYIVFDLQVQYKRMETWFGDANNQPGIKLGVQENVTPSFIFA
jgi:hypothetical protein